MSAHAPVSIGYFADYLNGGKRSRFARDEAVEFATPRGTIRLGVVSDRGPRRGEWWVWATNPADPFGLPVPWLVRARRPRSYALPGRGGSGGDVYLTKQPARRAA